MSGGNLHPPPPMDLHDVLLSILGQGKSELKKQSEMHVVRSREDISYEKIYVKAGLPGTDSLLIIPSPHAGAEV